MTKKNGFIYLMLCGQAFQRVSTYIDICNYYITVVIYLCVVAKMMFTLCAYLLIGTYW